MYCMCSEAGFLSYHYNALFIVAKGQSIAWEHIMREIFAGTAVVG